MATEEKGNNSGKHKKEREREILLLFYYMHEFTDPLHWDRSAR